MSYEVHLIPLTDIASDDEFNCRGPVRPSDVADLIRAIQAAVTPDCPTGLQCPIVVRPSNNYPGRKLVVVAGHRRFRAFSLLRRQVIPAYVREMSDVQARVLNLHENIQRQALNIVQESRALASFRSQGHTIEQTAKIVGMSASWVWQRFKLMDFPTEIQAEFAAGLLRTADIKKLARSRNQRVTADELKAKRQACKSVGKDRRKVITRAALRGAVEIDEMATRIVRLTGGASLATRALAWAAGRITTEELEVDLARWR